MRARIYTAQPLAPGAAVRLAPAASAHLLKVLRLAAGSEVIAFNGDGAQYRSRLAGRGREAVLEVLDARPGPPPSPLAITLVQGISRGDRMDFALQKATELGVAAIAPVRCERGPGKLDPARLAKRQRHWQAVIESACEQCGRCELPALAPSQALPDYLHAAPPGLVLTPGAEHALSDAAPAAAVALLIGPESGLSAAERAAAQAAGWRGVALGPRVLRTETAAMAAIAVLQARCGDLGGG